MWKTKKWLETQVEAQRVKVFQGEDILALHLDMGGKEGEVDEFRREWDTYIPQKQYMCGGKIESSWNKEGYGSLCESFRYHLNIQKM